MKPKLLAPVNKEGWPFVALALAAAALGALANAALAVALLCVAGFIAFFFRDPPRVTPTRRGLVVSPADGIVIAVDLAEPPPELGMAGLRPRIAIHMSPFDVHVNRAPISGAVTRLAYRPGRFVDPTLDKASQHNERQAYRILLEDGRDLALVQIAGVVSRRIVAWVREGDSVVAGRRVGMIRFGSRCDVYLPSGVTAMVAEGQRMVAGETVLADFLSREAQRVGEAR